jgi:hypothetical protein
MEEQSNRTEKEKRHLVYETNPLVRKFKGDLFRKSGNNKKKQKVLEKRHDLKNREPQGRPRDRRNENKKEK